MVPPAALGHRGERENDHFGTGIEAEIMVQVERGRSGDFMDDGLEERACERNQMAAKLPHYFRSATVVCGFDIDQSLLCCGKNAVETNEQRVLH